MELYFPIPSSSLG
jgi:hypothetical protein